MNIKVKSEDNKSSNKLSKKINENLKFLMDYRFDYMNDGYGIYLFDDDIINIPKLKLLRWQNGISIDHNLLKKNLLDLDREKFREAKLILNMEFQIAIQPKEEFKLNCIRKIMKNKFLLSYIRKIKVRKRNNSNFPTIVIYPYYGMDNFKLVLRILNYEFNGYGGYADNTHPYCFINFNELILVTRGDYEVKLWLLDKEITI